LWREAPSSPCRSAARGERQKGYPRSELPTVHTQERSRPPSRFPLLSSRPYAPQVASSSYDSSAPRRDVPEFVCDIDLTAGAAEVFADQRCGANGRTAERIRPTKRWSTRLSIWGKNRNQLNAGLPRVDPLLRWPERGVAKSVRSSGRCPGPVNLVTLSQTCSGCCCRRSRSMRSWMR
jgi:hypothetical protein